MRYKFIIAFILGSVYTTITAAQDNCNVFLWEGDSCRYEACKFLDDAPSYFQLRKEYHQIKDKAIDICPKYGMPYKHKSTAYLKTGDFINWKILIDKAVELNPKQHLDYRGWCRFQFFRDYKGAIADIEELESITNHDIGYCQNGDYHLSIAKGLCYKMIGEKTKAIQIIKDQIDKEASSSGLYDHLHLGVLYLETNDLESAIKALMKQLEINELAEAYYYLALTYKKMHKQEQYLRSIQKAKKLYESSTYMLDPYTHHVDKIYLKDIQNELDKIHILK